MNFQQINSSQNELKNVIKLQDQCQQQSLHMQRYPFTTQQKQKQIDYTVFQCLNQFYSKLNNFKDEIVAHFNNTIQKIQQKYQQRNASKIYQMKKKLEQYQRKLKIKEEQLQKCSGFMKKCQTLFQQSNILASSHQQKNSEKKQSQNKDKRLPIQNMSIFNRFDDKKQSKNIQSKPQNYRTYLNHRKTPIQLQRQKWDEQLIQSFKQNNNVKELKVNIRYPNYELNQVQIKPNKTKINYLKLQYIHCVCSNSKFDIYNKFSIDDLKSLNLYQLQGIQCIQLTQKQISDKIFYLFSKMECWKNLKALYIQDNLITDITPLNNFKLSEFVQLDISQNPLNKNSATFLSQFSFKSLIYFSTSFKEGQNQNSWRILLKNNFKNYPSLQALDIYWSDQLSIAMQKEITNVIQTSNIQQICDINQNSFRKVNVLIKFCPSKKFLNEKYEGKEQQKQQLLQKLHEEWIQLSQFKTKEPSIKYLQPKVNNLIKIKQQKPKRLNKKQIKNNGSDRFKNGKPRKFKTKGVKKSQKKTKKRIYRKKKTEKINQEQQKND